jgi:alpha-tubulin suppressor-like RCC1 family protein
MHCLSFAETGEVLAFGWGSYLQLGLGDTDNRFLPTQIQELAPHKIVGASCGGWHSAFISDIGDLYTCGWGEVTLRVSSTYL